MNKYNIAILIIFTFLSSIVFLYGWYLADIVFLKWLCVLGWSFMTGAIWIVSLQDAGKKATK